MNPSGADEQNSDDSLSLEGAYAIETPEDSRQLYAKWAATYDEDFVQATSYVYPGNVASAFVEAGGTAGGAVLDVGCGTGVVGVALADLGESTIDGIDISPEMLDIARLKQSVYGKAAYRTLLTADMTGPLDVGDDIYNGVISAGTFTHGHLGPEPLVELVRIAAPSAVFAIGINAQHYASHGFDALLGTMVQSGQITAPEVVDVAIFDTSVGSYAGDRANVVLFQVRP